MVSESNVLNNSIKDAFQTAMEFGLNKESIHYQKSYKNMLKQIAKCAFEYVRNKQQEELFKTSIEIDNLIVE